MRPLDKIKVIEMTGLAPSPYCGMILADFGADVVIVDRLEKGMPEIPHLMSKNPFNRGKRSMRVDLKTDEGIDIIRRMIRASDILVEPYRPGVMEKLGLGPDEALGLNPKIIYARLTGWGQSGPYASMAGHDINYIALSGALSLFRRRGERPLPPCNILADFAGGGMLCAMGIFLALIERNRSGRGQIVDAAMVDGSAILMAMFYGQRAAGFWTDQRASNFLDTGSHFYDTYETADGKWISVGSIEPQFYALLLKHAGIDDPEFKVQDDRTKWPKFKKKINEIFKTKTRDEWCDIMEGTDVCFGPVLSMEEAPKHPQNVFRNTFVEVEGVLQPAPAPRFNRTKPEIQGPPLMQGEHTEPALADWGFTQDEIQELKAGDVI